MTNEYLLMDKEDPTKKEPVMNPGKRKSRAKKKAKENRKRRSRGKDRVAALFRGEFEITEKGMALVESWK